MKLPHDWRWKAALGVFVLLTALAVLWPLPDITPSSPPAVIIPPSQDEPAADSSSTAPPDLAPDYNEEMLPYIVQEGDMWQSIARLFDIRNEALLSVNNNDGLNEPTPGETIWVPLVQ